MQISKKQKTETSQRVQGDSIWFFCVHNLISGVLFFILSLRLGLFTDYGNYLQLYLLVFGIMLLCGVLGRILGYLLLRLIFRRKPTRTFGEFNSGINKISFTYLITTLVSALLFIIGAIAILEQIIFNEDTLMTLIITYILVKIVVWFFARFFVSSLS